MVVSEPARFSLLASLAALWAFCGAAAAQAQDTAMVSANNPAGVLKAIEGAGYDAEFSPRGEDGTSAYIQVNTYDINGVVRFADCDEAVPDFCETLVLSTWWDRETPISDAVIAAANRENKYVSVYRDNDGDPVMQWAILTRREGVPTTVFLNALQRFVAIAGDWTETAFADDDPDPQGEAVGEEAGDISGEGARS